MANPQTDVSTLDGETFYDLNLGGRYRASSRALVEKINAGQTERDPHSNGGTCDSSGCYECAARASGTERV